jgi:hypothetical protein
MKENGLWIKSMVTVFTRGLTKMLLTKATGFKIKEQEPVLQLTQMVADMKVVLLITCVRVMVYLHMLTEVVMLVVGRMI